MKKKLFSILCLMLCALCFVGCASMEDLVPTELGEPEGLWLYRGAERMRTDGSERERLFTDIELNGRTFTEEDYKVAEYVYCPEVRKAFFVLSSWNEEIRWWDYYCYLYDYVEKTGRQLNETAGSYWRLQANDFYVCYFRGEQGPIEVYRRDGTFVLETETEYDLAGDVLWSYNRQENGEELSWWQEGVWHSVLLPGREGISYCVYDGEYLYDYSERGVYAVHSKTEEVHALEYEGTAYDYTPSTGELYFLTYEQYSEKKDHIVYKTYSGCRLYRAIGTKAELVYTFRKPWSMWIDYTNDVEGYIQLRHSNKGDGVDYYLNLKNGKLKKGRVPKKDSTEELICGEYTFWVGHRTTIFGSGYNYLYRSDGNKTEVMQYIFRDHGQSYRFYDDICEV